MEEKKDRKLYKDLKTQYIAETGTSGIGTLSMHGPDATVRSTESVANSIHSMEYCDTPKQEGKIKPYVDFSEFNKNYEDYIKRKKKAEQCIKT